MQKRNTIIKAIMLGILASLFLSCSFFINSFLAAGGSHWAWNASLRVLLLIPVLWLALAFRKELTPLLLAIKKAPKMFLLWGNIGFGIFYAALTYPSVALPGWLVAAIFQTTILMSLLIAPLVYSDHRSSIPKKGLLLSIIIVLGVVVMQLESFAQLSNPISILSCSLITLLAALLWPLGNRMLMLGLEQKNIELNAMQRVLGLCIGSLPTLVFLSFYGFMASGLPGGTQMISSFLSAFLSGVLGCVIFFKALHLVKDDPIAMAAVDATQVTSILFTLMQEFVLKGSPWVGLYGNIGFVIILVALSWHCGTALKSSQQQSFK